MRHLRSILFSVLLLSFSLTPRCQTVWIDPLSQGDVVHGQGWQELRGSYNRLPDKAKGVVRDAVWNLSRNSSGLSLVFRSDASYITVRYGVSESQYAFHMSPTSKSGVDLYATDPNGKRLWCAPDFTPQFGDTITYNFSDLTYRERRKTHEYHLYLPSYNTIKFLEIGINEGAQITFQEESLEKPIVVYGTSIAQGALASRQGLSWTNTVERELEHPLVNLAFSGNGRLEPEVFRLLSEIDAKMFIVDCMPNMSEQDPIEELILSGIGILRQSHDCPILLVEHSGYEGDAASQSRQVYRPINKKLWKGYQRILEAGYRNVFYMSHDEIAQGPDGQVEGIHPNDLGMRRHADAYKRRIKEILHEDFHYFTPIKQSRDSYVWFDRHEQVLRLAAQNKPRVLFIGDSITHFWGGEPDSGKANGSKAWNSLFKGVNILNLGFGWDRIENMLWRLSHGEIDGYETEDIFIMAGTNNLSEDTDEQIAGGILEMVQLINLRQPKARIHVLGIYPRRDLEDRITGLNALLRANLAGTTATFIDMRDVLCAKDGKIIEEYYLDGTHPNEKGYAKVAEVLRSYL